MEGCESLEAKKLIVNYNKKALNGHPLRAFVYTDAILLNVTLQDFENYTSEYFEET